MDLAMFSIDRVIVHEMPKRPARALIKNDPKLDVAPDLSTAETTLDPNQRNYLESRVKMSLEGGAYGARFIDPLPDSRVPPCILEMLGTNTPELVARSHEMALALHAAEHGATSEGLFVVAFGKRNRERMVAAIKLEKEEGVRLHRKRTPEGKTAIDLIIEHDLVLGEGTKIFKAGVFLLTPGTAAAGVEIWVSDLQNRQSSSKVVADFFLRRFLCCEPLRTAEIDTAEFFETVSKWTNDNIDDPVVVTNYQQALLAELNSQKQRITPARFVQDHIEQKDRAALRTALRDRGVYQPFGRDLELIESKVKQLAFTFESGVRVSATQEQFDKVIDLAHADGDNSIAKLTVTDRLRHLGG